MANVIPRWNTVCYEVALVWTVIANPVENNVLLSPWNGAILLFLGSHSRSLGPWRGSVITNVCALIAVVGQVTVRVWLWPLARHLHYHGHTPHSIATQVSAWRLRKVEWKMRNFFFLLLTFCSSTHYIVTSFCWRKHTELMSMLSVGECLQSVFDLVVSCLDLSTFLLVLCLSWG